jgi:alpha-L-rhamnosidase
MVIKKIMLNALLMVTFLSVSAYSQWSANWIWQSVDGPSNTWMCFRKTVTLASAPASAYARISADSKYWLWINGQLVVFEGQLKRNPNLNDTYYDSVNVASYLTSGTNTIAAQVWYWGKEGFGHHSSGRGGFLFDGNFGGTAVRSDNTWKARVHPAYQNSTTGGQPNFRMSEYNVRFNAQNDGINGWQQPGYNDASWATATAKGVPPVAPWNTLMKRPFPQWKNSGLVNYTNAASLPATAPGGIIDARLPYDSHVSVYLRINTPTAGQLINIQTDMYDSMYLFGEGPCLRSEYITKAGVQEFETFMWISGNTVKYTIPAGITIQALQYRELGYPAEFTGQFSCNDAFYNTLWQKARRTLYCCMHDDFMDCPDRERGLWWGDVTSQLGEIFYTLDTNSHALVRKAIAVLTGWQRADNTLFSPPSTVWTSELPLQMLASTGWYGFWNYFWNTNDSATIRAAYPAVKKYLGIWNMGSNGLVAHRDGGWNWGDWGTNIDMNILDNCWYYLALKAAIPLAAMSGYAGDTAGYRTRMNSIATNFVSSYWKTTGQYFMSSSVTVPDDRANAMAVLSGLAQTQHYAGIRTVLTQRTFASPWMEKFVLEALCLMKSDSLALVRMKSRYTTMVNANYTTLWEVWNGLSEGTINHGWNAPNTVLSQYIAGVSPTAAGWSSYSVLPQMANLTAINEVVPSIKGNITVSDSLSANQFVMNLVSPSATRALVGIPKKRAWLSVTANTKPVWNNGTFLTGVTGVSGAGEDSLYIKFNVDPGTWRFVASLTSVAVQNSSQHQTDFGVLPVQVRQSSQGLEIVAGTNDKYSVNVFDCAGHRIFGLSRQHGGIATIPRRFLTGRVYIVRVATDKDIVTRKIVVAH